MIKAERLFIKNIKGYVPAIIVALALYIPVAANKFRAYNSYTEGGEE